MAENKNCLLCGVGGQGTVLASKLIAFAAMRRGENVRTSETIGMAQRGGCVVSHVRTGDDIASPLVPKHTADVMIAFEPAEAVRCLDYLAPDGAVIVNKKAVMPITVNFGGAGYDADAVLLSPREREEPYGRRRRRNLRTLRLPEGTEHRPSRGSGMFRHARHDRGRTARMRETACQREISRYEPPRH